MYLKMDNALEAKECYILMKKEYRISRNIRVEWYLNRINTYITISRKNNVDDFHGELEVVSILPFDPPMEWDSDTAHEYHYLITERTQLHFLSHKYKLVLGLDLSPSLAVVNIEKGCIVLEEVFPTLEHCLKNVIKPFVIPGSQIILFPKIYVTIIAHTPFFKSKPQQVIVQGWLLINERENLEEFLKNVHIRLKQLQNQLAELTRDMYNEDIKEEVQLGSGDEGSNDNLMMSSLTPMVSPDIGFVNMLRYGLVALQLLPQNSMACMIVITDGVISLPDATMFDALLVQLRNLTISCGFLQVGSKYQPHTGFGYMPFNDLMYFLSKATCGVYLWDLPHVTDGYDNEMNDYHKSFLTWKFQKNFEEDLNECDEDSKFKSLNFFTIDDDTRIKRQEKKFQIKTSLTALLSCRLREGYVIKSVKLATEYIHLVLELSWKYTTSIEYHIKSAWPPRNCELLAEIWTVASYEFLDDVTTFSGALATQYAGEPCNLRSHYRQRVVFKYLNTLRDLRETDMLLSNLQSFPSNPLYYTVPDCVQKGIPVFYISQQTNQPVPSKDFQVQFPQFADFWLPICMLNINKWQKWIHTHRIGVILKHETPLPKNLHMTNATGRYSTVHSRHSELTLTSMLSAYTDFALIDGSFYIKYLYENESDTPCSFFIVRITSNRPPCLTIRVAFLGGTACNIRSKIIKDLEKKVEKLTVKVRNRPKDGKSTENLSKIHQEADENNKTELCCTILNKPIEKILIYYHTTPSNLFDHQVRETPSRTVFNARIGATNKYASENQALLRKYLHHRRWIWNLKCNGTASTANIPPNSLSSTLSIYLSGSAVCRVLETITKIRLNEGFKFAYSKNGIVTMAKEFNISLELHHKLKSREKHLEESDINSVCLVQYIMFPPHALRSTSCEDEGGDESTARTDYELITECWVEPQNGVVTLDRKTDSLKTGLCKISAKNVTKQSSRSATQHQTINDHSDDDLLKKFSEEGLNYRQIALSFFPKDRLCIWSLITYEYLSELGITDLNLRNLNSDDKKFNLEYKNSSNTEKQCERPNFSKSKCAKDIHQTNVSNFPSVPPLIQQIPFQLRLSNLLSLCPRTEILFSTLVQDIYRNVLNTSTFGGIENESNNIFYAYLIDFLKDLHNGKQFSLSDEDNAKLPPLLDRKFKEDALRFNVSFENYSRAPKWTCFIKHITSKHFLITLMPSSFRDLKSLIVNRENILDESNKAVQILDRLECLDVLKNSDYSEIPDSTIEDEESINMSQDFFTTRTKSTSNFLNQSNASNSSNISNRSSSLPQDAVKRRLIKQHKSQASSHDVNESSLLERRRQRYSSGPSGTAQQKNQPSIDSREITELDAQKLNVRGRALSLHCNHEMSPSKHGNRPLSSIEKKSLLYEKEMSLSNEKIRKRNTSLPSKCHTEFTKLNSKFLHPEIMQEDFMEARIGTFGEDDTLLSSSIETHEPIYASVTLPVYSFECKLSSIVNQFVASSSNVNEVEKCVTIDSTFKISDTAPFSSTERNSPITVENTEETAKHLREVVSNVDGSERLHEAVKDFDELDKFSGGKNVRAPTHSPEPTSEESDTIPSDSKYIKKFLECIERCHRLSFVNGCFDSLSKEYFVHSSDVQCALDQCQEVFLETDITKYLQIICGHLKDFRMRSYVTAKEIEKYYNFGTELGLEREENFLDLTETENFPLSILQEHRPCHSLISCHNDIKQSFLDILKNRFKPVPNMQDYYFYSPTQASTYTQAENKQYYETYTSRTKFRRKTDEFSELSEKDEDVDDLEKTTCEVCNKSSWSDEFQHHNCDRQIIDDDKSIIFRQDSAEAYSQFPRQFSQLSEKSTINGDENEQVDIESNSGASSFTSPLFVHLTCTLRYNGQTIGTSSVSTLPTCLADFGDYFCTPTIDLNKLTITLEVLILTLVGAADVSVENIKNSVNQLNTMSSKWRNGRRSASGCSSSNSFRRISESTIVSNSNTESEEMCLAFDEVLENLPQDQHKAVLVIYEKIKWLIQDQVVTALLDCYPVTHETLRLVRSHITASIPCRNSCMEDIKLDFVFGVGKSKQLFRQYFKKLKMGGYVLQKIGDYYYLAFPQDYVRKKRLSSMDPPLPLKRRSIELQEFINGKEILKEVRMDTNEFVSFYIGQEETNKKVSFEELRPSKKATKVLEVKNEARKVQKLLKRRQRRERRDSERRTLDNSSDSDNEKSVDDLVQKIKSTRSGDVLSESDGAESDVESSNDFDENNAGAMSEIEVKKSESEPNKIKENRSEQNKLKANENDLEQLKKQFFDNDTLEIERLENIENKLYPEEKCVQNLTTNDFNSKKVENNKELVEKLGRMERDSEKMASSSHTTSVTIRRSESVSLPHSKQPNVIIKKSASTDDFNPAQKLDLKTSLRNGSQSNLKSRHSSSGVDQKSRNNSGGPSTVQCSDISSHFESEGGCEADVSGSDDCADWVLDSEVNQLPDFWILIQICNDLIRVYFHCSDESKYLYWKHVQCEVTTNLKAIIKLVNQHMLLQDLNDTRKCNTLLEPETSDDVWKTTDQRDMDSDTSGYLEAAMKCGLGAFACPVVWSKVFELHPRLTLSGKVAIHGIQTLRKTLHPCMVENRKNMFVYQDCTNGKSDVFYLRLHEKTNDDADNVQNCQSISRSNSCASNYERKSTKSDDVNSNNQEFSKDANADDAPSISSLQKNLNNHYIVLNVHGIAEAGAEICENLVQMLQKRLDDAVIDAICLALWDNPHHKLTTHDVSFIQPKKKPPSFVIRYSMNSYARTNFASLKCYLKQNLMSSGFICPKYCDSSIENHFQDFQSDGASEAEIFLFVCSQKSGHKMVACVIFSSADQHSQHNVSMSTPRRPRKYASDLSICESTFNDYLTTEDDEFYIGSMLTTSEISIQDIVATDNSAAFEFKVWECGQFILSDLKKCLEDSIKHSLWDLNTERQFLTVPITPNSRLKNVSSLPTTPVRGAAPRGFASPRVVSTHDKPASPLLTKGDPVKTYSKSPAKLRHSVDFGRDNVPRTESKGSSDSSCFTDAARDEKFQAENLNELYTSFMCLWLEAGVKIGVPSLKKHRVSFSNKSGLAVVLIDLNRWLHSHMSDSATYSFKRTDENSYIRQNLCKISTHQSLEESSEWGIDYIICNRNERHWWAIQYEEDVLEIGTILNKAQKNMKYSSMYVAPKSSSNSQNEANVDYLSSPTFPSNMPVSTSNQSNRNSFKIENYLYSNCFVFRQMFLLATLKNCELTVYTYNWAKDLSEMLHSFINHYCHWNVARSRLLSSLVLQKLGIFNNQPFVRTPAKEDCNTFTQSLYHIEGLIKSVAPGKEASLSVDRSVRNRNQNLSLFGNFVNVLRDATPITSVHAYAGTKKDHLLKHGLQMIDVMRKNVQKERESKVLMATFFNEEATLFPESSLDLFKKHARLAHFCLTPMLFLPKWRIQLAAARDYSSPVVQDNDDKKESRSRNESGASTKSQVDTRRATTNDKSSNKSPTQVRKRQYPSTIGGEVKWHEALCLSYLKEFIQYLQWLSFQTISITKAQQQKDSAKVVRSASGSSNFRAPKSRDENRAPKSRDENRAPKSRDENREQKLADHSLSSPTYLIRYCFGGTILLQINFCQPYFSVLIYAYEKNRTENSGDDDKTQANFMDEIEWVKRHFHLHSFTYDFQLRAVSSYVSHRQLLFARGYHLSCFLSDFIKYYNKSPNFARNRICSGEIVISDTGTQAEQLYNYVLAREKEYQMRVLRMTSQDLSVDLYTEFVLVHTKALSVNLPEDNDSYEAQNYEVSLLVSHDTNASASDSATTLTQDANSLYLKFYVVLTSRRDLFPNRNLIMNSGKFKTVSIKSDIDRVSRKIANQISTSKSPVSGDAKNFVKEPVIHTSIHQESVNYFGFFSRYEISLQKTLHDQTEEAKQRIQDIFNNAKIHCRRDSLWQKMLNSVKDDEKSKQKGSSPISFDDFGELLSLVTMKSVSEFDSALEALISKPILWYQKLAKLLSHKFQDSNNYMSCILTSGQGKIQHVIVCSKLNPGIFMLLSIDAHCQKTDICCVSKDNEEVDFEDTKFVSFFEDFINCCCFPFWAEII